MNNLFKLFSLSLAAILTGCASTPVPIHDHVFFSMKLVDDLPPKVHGRATCASNNICDIEIRRESYPHCFKHEIRHGFEGNWHAGYETTWDC